MNLFRFLGQKCYNKNKWLLHRLELDLLQLELQLKLTVIEEREDLNLSLLFVLLLTRRMLILFKHNNKQC